MKHITSLSEWLLKYQMFEMADRDRNKSIDRVKSMRNTLNEHLFKYYLMPQCWDRKHWLGEISAFLYKISKNTWNKNKLFSEEDYYKWLFIEYFENKSDVITRLKKIETHYHIEHQIVYDIPDFEKRCDIFYNKICSDLANNQYDRDLSEIIKVFNVE